MRRPAWMQALRRIDPPTLAMAAGALTLNLLLPPTDASRRLAESLVGPVEPITLPGPPAFRGGSSIVLFFEVAGVQGRLRGAVVVEGERIEQVVLDREREGPDRTTLREARFLDEFRGRLAVPPLVVHTVTGATVSSQRVVDAVNERLKAWKAATP